VCCVGDLVEDIVVHAARQAVDDADVPARIERHRGGSAANTAAAVARLGGRARFVGRVGADDAGTRLSGSLAALGVECAGLRAGRTGTVVVVVEPSGARTMFSDRRVTDGRDRMEADARWLEGSDVVHVPYYAIADEPDGAARALLDMARVQGSLVSMDPSTSTLAGPAFAALACAVEPDIVFCNADEAKALDVDDAGMPGVRLVVVKRGTDPVLLRGAIRDEIAVPPVDGATDTTGTGDAFAGGFLLAMARGAAPSEAVHAALHAAACVVRGPGADSWVEP
jgi:sugar/nucleoside kinase (ribokinase family)